MSHQVGSHEIAGAAGAYFTAQRDSPAATEDHKLKVLQEHISLHNETLLQPQQSNWFCSVELDETLT